MGMKRIEIWAHTVENTEKDLSRTSCLLARLSERAGDTACNFSDPDARKNEALLSEVSELLYEFSHTLGIISAHLDHLEEHLRDIRVEAEK